MARRAVNSFVISCLVAAQTSIPFAQATDQAISQLIGDWIYADSGGTIQYSLLADGHYRSRSVLTAPGYPRFVINASGIYSVSGENVTFVPQIASSLGEPAKLVKAIGRYDAAANQLQVKPEGVATFQGYHRSTDPVKPPATSQDSTIRGMLLISLLAGGLITSVASFAVISRYKRAIRRIMEQGVPEKRTAIAADAKPACDGEEYLRAAQETAPPLLLYAQARAKRLGVVYSIAGLSTALVWTAAFLLEANAYSVKVTVAFFIIFAWPAVICWNQVTGWSSKRRWRSRLSYAVTFAVVAGVFFWGFAKNPADLLEAFVMVNFIPGLLALAFSAPGVRSIGPCLFSLSASCALGAWAIPNVSRENVSAFRLLSHLRDRLNTSALSMGLLMAVSALVFFYVGWLILQLIVRNYKACRNSDQSIQIDSIWLIWCLTDALFISTRSVSSSGKGSILALLGFPTYWIARKLGFIWLGRRDEASIPRLSLLYLRRFALNNRTDRLFRDISLLWRFVGGVRLLSGSDLARSTIQPHTLLNFISFSGIGACSSQQELSEQIRSLPEEADPDTRVRVSDFLCSNAMWKSAVSELIPRSDVVLADFRGFHPQNEGARYEIEALIRLKPLNRVLLITDTASARADLADAIAAAWRNRADKSPNCLATATAPKIILQVEEETDPLPVLRVLFSLWDPERGGRPLDHGKLEARARHS